MLDASGFEVAGAEGVVFVAGLADVEIWVRGLQGVADWEVGADEGLD